jgi:hypothetical protein
MTIRFFLPLALCPLALPALAQNDRLFVEGQRTSLAYNNVAVPGRTGTRFSLKDALGGGSWSGLRVTYLKSQGERRGVRLVYAPLQISGTGTLRQTTQFKGATFAANTPTDGRYRFNSYRVSWYKRDPKPGGEMRYGLTLKVRDADISLRQGTLKRNEYNLGFVPLIYVGGERKFSEKLTGYVDFDGLAGGPGRAFDLGLSLGYKTSKDTDLMLGLRTLEGGADVKEVYNFTRLNYLTLGLIKRF